MEYAQVKEEIEEEKIDICCSIPPLSFEQVEEGYSHCKVMLSFSYFFHISNINSWFALLIFPLFFIISVRGDQQPSLLIRRDKTRKKRHYFYI